MMLLTNNHSQHYLRLALAAAAILTLSFSCAREIVLESDTVGDSQSNGRDFTARFADEASRMSMNTSTGALAWETTDNITIFWASGNSGKTTATAQSAGSSTTFSGSGVGEAAQYYASFSPDNSSYDGTNLTVTISKSQSRGAENSIFMAATTTAAARNFKFYALTTMVKFQVADPTYTKAVFQGGNGEYVAGDVTLDFSNGEPVLSAPADNSNRSTTLTITKGNGFTTGTNHFFSVLPNTFSKGFSITFYKGDANPQTPIFVTSEQIFERGGYIDLGTVDSHQTTDLFVTPEGAGKKTGKNWDNALGTDELRELIEWQDDISARNFRASILDGVTFHLAEGDYFLAGEADSQAEINYNSVDPAQVSFTFRGGYPAGLTGTSLTGREKPVAGETEPTHCTAFTGKGIAGIIQTSTKTNITFEGITFKDGNADYRTDVDYGAVTCASGQAAMAAATFRNCRFTGNRKSSGLSTGGAALALNKVNATVDSCYFADNQAKNGAAINIRGGEGTVAISNCTFKNNGGIYGPVMNYGRNGVTISNCTFDSNTADYGGAFYCTGSGNLPNGSTNFSDCTFTGNTSTTKGGAVDIDYAAVTLSGCTFSGNSCTWGSKWIAGKGEERTAGTETLAGGAIALNHAKAQCALTGCTFTGNKAPNGCGGAIVISTSGSPGPALTIGAGNSFTGNTAFFHGGAIFAAHGFTLTGTSGSKVNFSGNKTLSTGAQVANGGALFLQADKNYSLSYAVFDGCEAGSESSSVCEYSNGGAIAARAVTSLTVANCEFTACRGRNGGCLEILPGSSSSIAFNSCSFHDNICRSGAGKNGTAGNFHGAVACVGGEGAVSFNSCTFEDNVAHHSGGVLHLNSETAVINGSGCTFGDNSVSDTSGGYGGAVSLEKGTLNLSGSCVLSDNTARYAGALCIDDGTAVLASCTLSGNSATNGNQALRGEANTAVADNVAGGAILMRNAASMCTITGCTLSGNTAPNGCGGAIGRLSATADRLRINLGTTFENNTAYFHGGAIFSMGNVEINARDASGSDISSASASSSHVCFDGDCTTGPDLSSNNAHGGAIYLKGGTSHVNYTEFSSHKAGYLSSTPHAFGGAVALSGNTTLRGSHCSFSSCCGRRGGVIMMNGGAKSDLSDCRFYQNTTTDSWGSCVYMDNGEEGTAESLYLNRCIFEENATASRGVIACVTSGRTYTCYMNRVSFKNNSNTNTGAGNQFGVIIHSNGGVCCLNNVTCVGNSCGSTNASNYSFALQKILAVNCTILDNVYGNLINSNKVHLCNNIFINGTSSNKIVAAAENSGSIDNGHSLVSANSTAQTRFTLAASDKLNITSLGSGTWSGSWNATTLSGDLVYAWNGSVAAPFTWARQADVEAAITGFNVSNGSVSHVGNDFLTWLRGCATDHTYDARDLARGSGDWWPGAYQGGPSKAAEVEPFDPLTPIDF